MITKKNIEDARIAEAKAKDLYEKAKINLDAFEKYIGEINQGIWDAANSKVPTSGPLTVSQAKMVNVNIPEDYSYPQVFTMTEVWNLSATQLTELRESIKDLAANLEMAKGTTVELEKEYVEEMDRAAEVAASDPNVIAAKENLEAEKVKAAANSDKAAERAENRKMLFQGLIGVAAVAVFIIIIAKVIK